MQNVSKAYKESMKCPLRNRGYIRARIGIINLKAQESIAADESRNRFTYYADAKKPFDAYTVDKVYATPEQDFSKVDGSMYFLPRENSEFEYYNNGIVTEELLGTAYLDFGGQTGFDIKGFTIDFGECYPTEFTIETDIGSISYTNDKRIFATEDVFYETSYIIITPLKMVNGHGRLRIHQFNCGIINNFTNKEVKTYTFKDYVSSITETIPSQDMSLTVDNQNLYYSPDNPESAIAFMEQGQEINIEFGYDIDGTGNIEWVNENTAYLKTWSATDVDAKFTAVDIFDYKMSDTYYRGKYREEGISLYDLALDVLNDAGITDEREYFIDPYLKDVIVNNPVPAVKQSEALQIIANAGRCALYLDRMNRIHMQSSFIPDMYPSSNGETGYSHVENILEDDEKDAYAICSNDFSILDGSLSFMPRNENYLNTGYISYVLADGNGNFTSNPKIIIDLEAGFIMYGMIIKFRNIAPKEFHIVTYYQGEKKDDVKIKDPGLEFVTHEQFNLFDKMEIIFVKGYPNARVTVDNVLMGDVTDYTLSRTFNLKGSPEATRQNKIKSISVQRNLHKKSEEEIKNLSSEELNLPEDIQEHTVYFTKPSYGFSVTIDNNPGDENNEETITRSLEEVDAGDSYYDGPITAEILESSDYFVKLKFDRSMSKRSKIKHTIKGYEYVVEEQIFEMQHHGTGEEIEWNNPLVSDLILAMDLEEWLAAFYLGDVDYQITWNGDPRVDANDLFYLELKDREKVLIRASQNELKFSGAWSANMKARRVKNVYRTWDDVKARYSWDTLYASGITWGRLRGRI